MSDVTLNLVEARVLGAMIEKQISTPEYYPLTLNALVAACSQKSNRHPVISYSEQTVQTALDSLREKQLARVIYENTGRVPKYGHSFTKMLDLSQPEIAVLCELMLRGPQTVGELRGRTARLHDFQSLAEVEGTLEKLLNREAGPLVKRLPRQTGYKESRWAHLLSGEPVVDEEEKLSPSPASGRAGASGDEIAQLKEEIQELRQEIAEVKRMFADFKKQFE